MPISPPRPKGPPLNALRAFEAAARLGSFSAAAEELSVTAGAVSQQIKSVEDWAGTQLFKRHAQGVGLTREGRELSPVLTRAFDEIANASAILRSHRPDKPISIASLPSIAQLWLQPRLAKVRASHTDANLAVYALETPPDMRRAPYDLSFFLQSPSGAAHQTVLAEDALLPVCTPEVAARLTQLSALGDEILLLDESWASDWSVWASHAGFNLQHSQRFARYSLYSMALADALAGFGVLMGHRPLVADLLEQGRLVCPYDTELKTGKALVMEVAPAIKPDSTAQKVAEELAITVA